MNKITREFFPKRLSSDDGQFLKNPEHSPVLLSEPGDGRHHNTASNRKPFLISRVAFLNLTQASQTVQLWLADPQVCDRAQPCFKGGGAGVETT